MPFQIAKNLSNIQAEYKNHKKLPVFKSGRNDTFTLLLCKDCKLLTK